MDAFLKTLQTLPEASELIARVENGGCPAVLTGSAPMSGRPVNWQATCKASPGRSR